MLPSWEKGKENQAYFDHPGPEQKNRRYRATHATQAQPHGAMGRREGPKWSGSTAGRRLGEFLGRPFFLNLGDPSVARFLPALAHAALVAGANLKES